MIKHEHCDIPFQREVNDELWHRYMTKTVPGKGQVPLGENCEDYENKVFAVRSFDWSEDGDNSWHFWHKESGFKLSWYKYPLRGASANMKITEAEFLQILKDCRNSILEDEGSQMSYGGIDRWWLFEPVEIIEGNVATSEDKANDLVCELSELFEDVLTEKGIEVPNSGHWSEIVKGVRETLRAYGVFELPKAEHLSPEELRRAHELYEKKRAKENILGVIEVYAEAAEEDGDKECLEKLETLKKDIDTLVSDYFYEKSNDFLFDDGPDDTVSYVVDNAMKKE